VVAKAKATFASYGVSVDEGLLPYLRSARDFQYMVRHAHETLDSEGVRYAKSGYDSPHERFREVISRFAELKQVEYAAEPQLLHYLAPGLDQIWEAHYIPHLHRVYDRLVGMEAAPVAGRSSPVVSKEGAAPAVAMGANACFAQGIPATRIDAQTVEFPSMMDERNVAALRTLDAMGIAAR
jgi:hypothetical protein